jgi:hypothetical protein
MDSRQDDMIVDMTCAASLDKLDSIVSGRDADNLRVEV